jgi:hypothetical protein
MTPAQQHLWAWYGLFGCLSALVFLAILVIITWGVTGNSDTPEFVYAVGAVLVIAGVIFLIGT